ncbi:hypothetical protein GC093_16885 [Paenibacillus sp. LMG 31456]|uniref:Helix-turn-helix domain-containing protein n=1 Tax=Paenibacillus foliorum TaxID=2654974 RepID=A0A972JZS1_9BACL|nr:hypothetical protein [Paenibacillus foliorum]NOU94884.1 hypothetical protein [Paenibacillus foliorum]
MKKFIEDMILRPFEEWGEASKQIASINAKYYLPTPDILRRCYFIQQSEKQVLFELMSWASSNHESDETGYCSVPELIIRGATNLSRSSIMNAIKSLKAMGFIEVRRYYNQRSRYKIMSLSKNPYVLISEWVHYDRKQLITNWESLETSFDSPDALAYSAHCFTEACLIFVNTQAFYMPFINRLAASYDRNFIEEYNKVTDDVSKKIGELYDDCFVKQYKQKS